MTEQLQLHDTAPHRLCYDLDVLCAPYYFTYSGSLLSNTPDTIHVYKDASSWSANHAEIATFTIDEGNPLEYVVTKIMLQFGSGA